MKKLFSDPQLEEARRCVSPLQNITSCNRPGGSGVKNYVIFNTRMISTESEGFLPKKFSPPVNQEPAIVQSF